MGPAARWSSVTPTLTGCALTTPAAACQVWMGCPGTLGTSTVPSSSFNAFPAANRVLTTVGLDLSPGSGCGFPPRLLLLGWLIRNSGIPLSSGPAPPPRPILGRVTGPSRSTLPPAAFHLPGERGGDKEPEERAAPEPTATEEGRLVKEGNWRVLGHVVGGRGALGEGRGGTVGGGCALGEP